MISGLAELLEGDVPDQRQRGLLRLGGWPTAQFASSPDLTPELTNAIIESCDAHTSMSTRALNSPQVLRAILNVLLNHSPLYETLLARASQQQPQSHAVCN